MPPKGGDILATVFLALIPFPSSSDFKRAAPADL
jgi:hypothetical protein